MTGTVYVVAGKIDGTSDWVVGGPDAPLMTVDDIRAAAAAGHEVASHTTTHAAPRPPVRGGDRLAGGG